MRIKAPDLHALREDLGLLAYFMRLVHRLDRAFLPLTWANSLVEAAQPFVAVIIPRLVIDELMGAQRPSVLLALVIVAAGASGVLYLAGGVLGHVLERHNLAMNKAFNAGLGRKSVEMDFENLENPDVLAILARAQEGTVTMGGMYVFGMRLGNLLSGLLKLAGMFAVLATLDRWIILLVMAVIGLNLYWQKRAQDEQVAYWGKMADFTRQYHYYYALTGDYENGKDIRLYNTAPMITRRIDAFVLALWQYSAMSWRVQAHYGMLQTAGSQLQMSAVYGYLAYQVLARGLSIGSFAMLVAAASGFSTALNALGANIMYLRQNCRFMRPFQEYLALPEKMRAGDSRVANGTVEIEFDHVTFTYPRGQAPVLKDVTLKIAAGERLAIVGVNGAGKTTLIKLLARLYEPDAGCIRLNGVDIRTMDYDAYVRQLAVVFQDFKLLSFSLRENVALEQADEDNGNEQRILAAVDKAGLGPKIGTLEKGLDTSIYKNFDAQGIELSGGEAQKLAIARAIYRDAPMVVLDEPTAALDPLAEYEIYQRFDELIGGKTTVYISHRLSSCRFCDRIAVFDGGELVQYGSHEDLLRQADGRYAEMWRAQAQYYVTPGQAVAGAADVSPAT